MGNPRRLGRTVALVAAILIVAILALRLLGVGASHYRVHAIFQDASQLVKGNLVQVAGVPVGKVSDLRLTPDGLADVTLEIDDGAYAPLRRGTIATVRQASLSGIANRYVDLRLPPAGTQSIADGGRIDQAQTNSAVDLDQLFDTFDPTTRQDLSGVIRGLSTIYGGRSAALQRGYLYLSPALAASSDLFGELDRDTPLLTRFVVASSKLVTDLAARRTNLAGAVDHLATAATAIGSQRAALADAIHQLPAFLRRADTTFVNLRATLDDLDEARQRHEARGQAAPALPPRPAPARARRPPDPADPPAADREPEDPERRPPLARAHDGRRPRHRRRTGRRPTGPAARGRSRRPRPPWARPRPSSASPGPYSPDLTAWFNSFSHSGVYDALGGASRVAISANPLALVDGLLSPIPPALRPAALLGTLTTGQRDRCPGSAEHPSADGSNPYHPPGFPCDPTQVLPGP